jgi:hypothetical protein
LPLSGKDEERSRGHPHASSLLVDLQHTILAAQIREHGVDRDGAPDPVILR